MPESYRFYIFTIGCKINQYETQALRESWLRKGYEETSEPQNAHIILMNSCAVTEKAVQDLRKLTRRFYRNNPQSRIIITGCAAEFFKEQLMSLPGVVALVSQKKKGYLNNLCLKHVFDNKDIELVKQDSYQKSNYQDFFISDFPRARAVLKVQDGCSQACTYCIVPMARGPSRSRDFKDISEEADRLVRSGFQELVLSGINLNQYGEDLEQDIDFWDLLHWLDKELYKKWKNSVRIRLSSLDPALLRAKGLKVLENCYLLCPHLHLSVQSASTKILQKMGRNHYDTKFIFDFLEKLRGIWPIYALGVDILLGFPGEMEEDFEQTYNFCQDIPLSYAHVFTYSPRPATKAAKMSGQVPEPKKKQRSKSLRELAAAKKQSFLRQISKLDSLQVILEQTNPCLGLCEYYVLCYLQEEFANLRKKNKIEATPVKQKPGGLLVNFKDQLGT